MIRIIVKDKTIIAISEQKITVRYELLYSRIMKRWLCSCPDYQLRRQAKGEDCKHIRKLKEILETASMKQLEEMER